MLDALDDQQRAAAECLTGPVVIHAGAGTGKTRTITHRIAHGVAARVYEPTQTLAVTYTNRAAGEMRGRLAAMGVAGVQVRTFHSAALRQVHYFYPQVFRKDAPTLLTSKIRAVEQAAASCGLPRDRDYIRDLAGEIEWAKVNILSPDAYRERTQPRPLDAAEVAQAYQAYVGVLDGMHAMDFEDVLLTALSLLSNYPDIATQVQRQYRHFTVDEFQDVSPVQFELLRAWLGSRDDVCVVGDPAQTIYSFTGATSTYLDGFATHFPGARRVDLTHSYRSTPAIVATANNVMQAAPHGRYVRLDTSMPDGPAVVDAEFATDQAEAEGIATWVSGLVRSGVPPREIAVLYRINSQSEVLEHALHDAGVAYSVRGAQRFFERPEVKLALVALRAAGAGRVDKPLGEQVTDVLAGQGWSTTPPADAPAARAVWESLNVLVDLASEHGRQPTATMASFVANLNARASVSDEPTADAVTLATIHSAKGLEWDAVAVAGLSDGLLPVSYATTPDAIAEERRVLYVAVTRARRHLHLSWAHRRLAGGTARSRSLLLPD